MNPYSILVAVLVFFVATASAQDKNRTVIKNQKHVVSINTPDEALAEMKAGNKRFVENRMINTNYKEQIEHTKNDQHPHTIVLSCMDSRVPPEILFDEGIGNIFVTRLAGNVEDAYVLGSIEYAVKVKGTKLIIVMGHSNCGAVKGAVDNVQLGNLTQLLDHIKPAILSHSGDVNTIVSETCKKNVAITITDILDGSEVINGLVKEGRVKIVGAYYDLATGTVTFL